MLRPPPSAMTLGKARQPVKDHGKYIVGRHWTNAWCRPQPANGMEGRKLGTDKSVQYVRIYPGADGESHFEDVQVPVQSVRTATGISASSWRSMPIGDALTFATVDPDSDDEGSPSGGGWGPWNVEKYRQFVLWLEGEVEIQVGGGEVRRFGPGELILAEDVSGRGHRSRRLSATVRSVAIPLAPDAPPS